MANVVVAARWLLWLYWDAPGFAQPDPGDIEAWYVIGEVEARVDQLGDSGDQLCKMERWLTEYLEANPQVPRDWVHLTIPPRDGVYPALLSIRERIDFAGRNFFFASSVPLVAGWADFL